MAKYIDADKLKGEWLKRVYIPHRCGKTLNSMIAPMMMFIDDIPAADVVEVKHGYNKKYEYSSLFKCSVCGWEDWDTYTGDTAYYNYCPNCGAKMDGKED